MDKLGAVCEQKSSDFKRFLFYIDVFNLV